MKTIRIFSIALVISLISIANNPAEAVNKKTTETEIKVLGNCGMCKERIENAAYSVKGVRRANWDEQSKMLTLVYRNDRTEQETIERAIAKAGHDTENIITDEETHANLHHCCIYPRNAEWLENNKRYDEE
ncbi:MAG: heavy-metal-associated domain-containing protein [Bacteroidota bacterium]